MRLDTSGTTTKRMRLDRRPAAPVFVVGVERQALVRLELADLVGAGGDRRARPVDPGLGLLEGAPADDLQPSRPMRPSSVTSGARLTKRTVYLSITSTFSSDGKLRLATPRTSAGSFLPSMLSRASTVVKRVLSSRLS